MELHHHPSSASAAVPPHAALTHPDAEGARPTAVPPGAMGRPRPRVTSDTILRGTSEVEIDHHGAIYRLRLTALGKLILTK